MRIAVGSDHRGCAIRIKLVELLQRLGHEVIDVGTKESGPVDYPDIACEGAGRVSRGEVERCILVCGTGLGMCIAANKLRGVRAAPCHDDLTADMLGERLIDRMVEIWLTTPFEGGRHARRLEKIAALEQKMSCEKPGNSG
jgi:ribose 5-phosphate isomerase B